MKAPFPDDIPTLDRLGRVHFVGIGGAALSGIARIMLARGAAVTGSDAAASSTLDSLRALGAVCFVGHEAAHVVGADTVVVSTAIRDDNPEVLAARRAGARLWPRSAAMVCLMADHTVLAVAGTHGKTTTTSLLAVALLAAGLDPSYTIGADLTATDSNAHAGTDDLFVAEADESDGAFLRYAPTGAVITNVDADHLDYYGTEAAYYQAFSAFLGTIRPGGYLIACVDDPGASRLAAEASGLGFDAVRVGTGPESHLRAVDVQLRGAGSTFAVEQNGVLIGRVELQIPGQHYALDATAALAAGLRLGLPFDDLARGMAAYTGARRRMERKGEAGGVRVYDSYAHHPTEIRSDLAAARSIAEDGRLVVCFQPHLASRTRIFASEMGQALSAADAVIVTDIYLAREAAEAGVNGRLVAESVVLPAGVVHYEPDLRDVPGALADLIEPGDLVLTLGAGDVTDVGPRLLALLRTPTREARL